MQGPKERRSSRERDEERRRRRRFKKGFLGDAEEDLPFRLSGKISSLQAERGMRPEE